MKTYRGTPLTKKNTDKTSTYTPIRNTVTQTDSYINKEPLKIRGYIRLKRVVGIGIG